MQNKAKDLIYRKFKTYYIATVIKTIWYWHKRDTQDNGIKLKSPKLAIFMVTFICVFDKDTKPIHKEIISIFNNEVLFYQISTYSRMKLDPYNAPHAKMDQRPNFTN